MLEQISWKEFIIVIGSVTAAYYGVLAVADRLRNKKARVRNLTPPAFPDHEESTANGPATVPVGDEHRLPPEERTGSGQPEDADDSEFSLLEQLADEVQVIITQFATTSGDKEQLLEYMAKEVAQYPMLNKPAFKRAINNLIVKVAKEECSLVITEDEVSQVWPTLPYDSQA